MEGKQTVPQVMLNSGKKMPVAGFGTIASPLPPNEELTSIFMDGIEAGYRHFDTAAVYGTEQALGGAIRIAVEQGVVRNREEIFVTSKLWCSDAHHDLVLPALRKTLENLGLEYVDLYLIHWPVRLKQGVHPAKIEKDDLLPFDIKGTWEAMEECQKQGLTKSIGVSNYGIKKLTQVLENATIPPAVNQVEMNPAWQQAKIRAFCKEKGILVSAWSPLGAYNAIWGTAAVMENPILQEIAAARNKSVPQIALRWIFEQGISFVVKSFKKERMKHNLEIFDFKLSQQELEKIGQIPQQRMYKGEKYVSEIGPYKSLEELWDGEP